MQARCGCRSVGAAAGRYGGNQDTGQVWMQEHRCSSRIQARCRYRNVGAAASDKPGEDQLGRSGTREQASG
ncbi:unnamed protein product [Staurois parvus]|uniref:Uncharacterized protein n=1 Tax=Staurois parvus TaxID=386267 RepID=A0ABN9B8Q0_9NEOB|nr:unnamed protein product [Staurois parvus]